MNLVAKKSEKPIQEPHSIFGMVLAAIVAMVAVLGLVILISGEMDKTTGQSFNSYSIPDNMCSNACPAGSIGKPIGHKGGANVANYCLCMKPPR